MTPVRAVTTFGGVGLLRPAPGTWGSAAALALGLVVLRTAGFPALVLLAALAAFGGMAAIRADLAGRGGGDRDPPDIVIDEVAGQWVALCFPAAAFWWRGIDIVWPGWVAAFLLFRLFDIWKPWLVGRADRRGDAAGVMLDDLWAGLFAGIAAWIAAALAHGVLLR
ncbi:MAG: phosphatidylglycerophosphatase A [Thermoleophilia bacterium]|nr:phosphatidylglycerophosphatase A [Thermoleophilia bacterium]